MFGEFSCDLVHQVLLMRPSLLILINTKHSHHPQHSCFSSFGNDSCHSSSSFFVMLFPSLSINTNGSSS
eukprot:jgi/Botrbrau1/21228/Bobra.39_2s0027.1